MDIKNNPPVPCRILQYFPNLFPFRPIRKTYKENL